MTTNAFGYNLRSEVASAVMGANQFGYRFDPIGNRIASTNNAEAFSYAANELNQYTSIVDGGTVTPAYDDDGNLTSYGSWTYTWDGENRLLIATDGSAAVTNAYDFASRRAFKGTAVASRAFIYDGWNLISEIKPQSSEVSTTFYVWGLDLSQTLQGAGGVGGLVSVVRGDAPYFTGYDANGNVTDYVSANGTTVAHYEFDPFGNTTAATGSMADDFAYRFSTKYWDSETGLYYYGHRSYSPELGRWLSRDPIGDQSVLLRQMLGKSRDVQLELILYSLEPTSYAYVLNDPLNWIDPIGLCRKSGESFYGCLNRHAKEFYGASLDVIDDLGYYGLTSAAVGLGTDAYASLAESAARDAVRNAPIAGVEAGGSMIKRQVAAGAAARSAARLGITRGILAGLSKLSGVIGAAATGFSAGARIAFIPDCMKDCCP